MASFYLTIPPTANKISHIWKTNIQTTIKGVEKRSMLYTWPRVAIYNEFIADDTERINYLKRNIFRYGDVVWGIPVWMDKTLLTAQANSGQKTLNVGETASRHFYAGRQCIIINPSNHLSYEVGTIVTVNATSLVLLVNLVSTWAGGSLVFPLYDCRINVEQELGAEIMVPQTFQVLATEAYEAARTFVYSAPDSGADTYEGLDLFLHKMMPSATYKYKRQYDLAQYLGIGYGYTKFDSGESAMGFRAGLIMEDREDICALFDFFDSKQGRLEKFWVPTWSKDIVVDEAFLDSDTVLNIENMEYNTYYLPDDVVGRYIYIQFPDRTYACRKILDASTGTITLDSAIGVTVLASELPELLISFLMLARFDIDELEIDYLKESIGQADLSFAGLVGEAV